MNILFLLDLLSFFFPFYLMTIWSSLGAWKKKKKSPPKLADVYWYCWWQYIYTTTKSSCSAEPTFSLHPIKMNANLKAQQPYQQTECETTCAGETAPAMTSCKGAATCFLSFCNLKAFREPLGTLGNRGLQQSKISLLLGTSFLLICVWKHFSNVQKRKRKRSPSQMSACVYVKQWTGPDAILCV